MMRDVPDERIFTREEAEALLPEVERLLLRGRELTEQVSAEQQARQEDTVRARRNGHVRPEAPGAPSAGSRETAAREIADLLQQLQEMGVLVRDLRSGIIDFIGIREGRQVCLCWRLDEPHRIMFWHELDAGFAGRQPLD